jgi:hypothetical protein
MRRATLATILLVLLLAGVGCGVAMAGSYEVSACGYAPEAVNNSWVWASNDPSTTDHYAEHINCPDRIGGEGGKTDQEGGLSTTDALHLTDGAPPKTSAGWQFTAATGTTITAIKAERYIGHELDSSNIWVPALRADGSILTGESCMDTVKNGEFCYVGGPPNEGTPPAEITGLTAHQLSIGIECQAPQEEECITGATKHSAWAALYAATVTVNDPTPPTLSTPTGPLWAPGEANGYHAGSESVTITAEDIGGGVQSITLTADGQPIATYTATCNYTYTQPCPSTTGPQTLTLPTSQLTDGTHTITLIATDAASNQSIILSQQINIDNNPPPAPTQLTATPTQPGSYTYTATWQNPTSPTPITSATYQLCPTNTPAACTTPTQAPAQGPATITLPNPGTWTLAVWLTNAANKTNPNNAATTQITTPIPPGPEIPPAPPPSEGRHPPPNTSPPPQPSKHKAAHLHISGYIRGRYLCVQLTGPYTGRVSLTYTVRYHNSTIAHATKSLSLRRGHQTAKFALPSHLVAHTAILIDARLAHSKTTAHSAITVAR